MYKLLSIGGHGLFSVLTYRLSGNDDRDDSMEKNINKTIYKHIGQQMDLKSCCSLLNDRPSTFYAEFQ